MHHIPRGITYTDQFVKELEEIEPDVVRADEFIHGVEYLICQFPDRGKHKDTVRNVWAWAMNEYPNVVLYYTFNDKYIWLLSIKKFENENNNGR